MTMTTTVVYLPVHFCVDDEYYHRLSVAMVAVVVV
jgi:hypothetical protein